MSVYLWYECVSFPTKTSLWCGCVYCSTWDKEEHILYLLLDYAEMDLNVVIFRGGKQNVVNPMASTIYFWNQMLQVVKVNIAPKAFYHVMDLTIRPSSL